MEGQDTEQGFSGLEAAAEFGGTNLTYPFYSHVFGFEEEFQPRGAQTWVQDNWVPVVAWSGAIYVILVFSGQAFMASRPAFQLRGPLAAWSAFLALFSILGFARTFPEFLHSILTGGLYGSVCDTGFVETNKVSGYWTWLFTLSKMPELGDTVFIVLRKQQLIFLHWYHHLTVLIYCFYCFSQFTSCARWFMVMNYFVHSVMYTYFALRAIRVRVPKAVAMGITSLQLLQMVVGCYINYQAFQFKQSGRECSVSDSNLMYSSLMYTSYFVLFARFFYNAYLCKYNKKSKQDGMLNGSTAKFGNVIQAGKKDSSEEEGSPAKQEDIPAVAQVEDSPEEGKAKEDPRPEKLSADPVECVTNTVSWGKAEEASEENKKDK